MGAMGFHKPATIDAAAALLAADGEARCLAGGATLVAMMNARLIEPTALVSLRHIDALRGITAEGDGFCIGAMTPHCVTAADERLAGGHAVVAEAAAVIANPGVRNMGTIGGSIAFADPAADYPPALVAIGAEIGIVASALEWRDHLDRTRLASPLTAAADAQVIDTTGVPVDSVVGQVLSIVRDRLGEG